MGSTTSSSGSLSITCPSAMPMPPSFQLQPLSSSETSPPHAQIQIHLIGILAPPTLGLTINVSNLGLTCYLSQQAIFQYKFVV